jgi:hypothetical protein
MKTPWTQVFIQASYIDVGLEENTILEYKAAAALDTTTGKKKEIAKDVSAMANAAGGTILYGVKEFDQPDKRHLPERFDPVERTQFSREWLEQVITSNIRPKVEGLIITPVDINTGSNHVVYVVEVPKSTTAHQVTADNDNRYYKRVNVTVHSMEDHEIRDVMNRSVVPNAEVEFSFTRTKIEGGTHSYALQVKVRNVGAKVIEGFKLNFSFPSYGPYISYSTATPDHRNFGYLAYDNDDNGDHLIIFRSRDKLFPEDEIDVGREAALVYHINNAAYAKIRELGRHHELALNWVLFADDMPSKKGKIPFSKLHSF